MVKKKLIKLKIPKVIKYETFNCTECIVIEKVECSLYMEKLWCNNCAMYFIFMKNTKI